ncbi:MAG: class I SAM-dependent rRNA methyltransferase [Clostridia bacterium]|nr:class I SAM-dependent rRNA methyltransferase [Clostridia bacterium]
MRSYPTATITEKAEKTARAGHPWIFADEVVSLDGGYENGDIVDVRTAKGRFIGSGFINDASKIRIRLISRNANDKFDEDFWARRVKYAVDYRKTVMPGSDFRCCRLIFGEADSFPGLTVDRFDNVLVTEVLSLGAEKRKDVIYESLLSYLRGSGEDITAIYERSDSEIRALEGMDKHVGYCYGGGDGTVVITENGIKYEVDYENGQKTGFFLDQKYNRAAVGRIAQSKKVLDCFTHTGAFALNAAKGGAAHVTALDISEKAIADARKNAELNCLQDKVDFVCADVFDYLTQAYNENRRDFDFIILDPPAFTKSRTTIKDAMRGYKEINLKAMRLLPRGGYLATCSCSHFMRDSIFCQMLHSAAEDAGVSLRQIEARQQSPDHPILWNVPETDYLKFYIFQIV